MHHSIYTSHSYFWCYFCNKRYSWSVCHHIGFLSMTFICDIQHGDKDHRNSMRSMNIKDIYCNAFISNIISYCKCVSKGCCLLVHFLHHIVWFLHAICCDGVSHQRKSRISCLVLTIKYPYSIPEAAPPIQSLKKCPNPLGLHHIQVIKHPWCNN